MHKSQRNIIYFATRGSKTRQEPLQQAIQHGIKLFETKWNTVVETDFTIYPQSPIGEPCLSVTDYVNWAVYRVFDRGEMRYFNLIRDKVSLVLDLYDSANYKGGGNFYTRKNPLDAKKISPL